MTRLALKNRLANYLRRHHGWISSGDLQRIAAERTSYSPQNVGRLRELENQGVIEVEYRKGHAWYRGKERSSAAQLEWFERLPGRCALSDQPEKPLAQRDNFLMLGSLFASIWEVDDLHPHTAFEIALSRVFHIVMNVVFAIVAFTIIDFTLTYGLIELGVHDNALATIGLFLMFPSAYLGLKLMKFAARWQVFTLIGLITVCEAYYENVGLLFSTSVHETFQKTYWEALTQFVKAVFVHIHGAQ